MLLEDVFSAAGLVAMAGWLVLALTPYRLDWPRTVIGLIAVLLGLTYCALLGSFWVGSEGGFGSLSQVATLFQSPGLLLAGWVHYLAFDLLVGLWERGEARRLGISRWLLAPCLALTFMFGPFGWLGFLALRHFHGLNSPRSLSAA